MSLLTSVASSPDDFRGTTCDKKKYSRIAFWPSQVPHSCLYPGMVICRGITVSHSFRLLCFFGITNFRGKRKRLCTANAVLMAYVSSLFGLLSWREIGNLGCFPPRTISELLILPLKLQERKANTHLKWLKWMPYAIETQSQLKQPSQPPQWLLHWILHSCYGLMWVGVYKRGKNFNCWQSDWQ